MKNKWITASVLALIVVVAVAVLLLRQQQQPAGKTFVFCSEGDPEGFNPALYTAGTTFDASEGPLFDTLVAFIPGTTSVEPALAESWEISADGLAYTFNLRQDVKFHSNDVFTPTRDFNSDDVIFSFLRQHSADHPWHSVSGGNYQYYTAMSMDSLIDSVDKIDDYTVRFTLTRPEAPFIANMAMSFASIHSAEYAEQMLAAGTPEQLDLQPIGTGPFLLENYSKDDRIDYVVNPDYWAGRSKLDRLIFSITVDSTTALQKLKAGECHFMPYPNPADLVDIEADPDLKLQQQEGLNVGYLAFNVERPPFNDVRVRRALNMAIDKQAIIDAVFQGSAAIAKNPIPPIMWSYNDSVTDYQYDPDRARVLLEEAGVTNLSTNIWAMPVARPYNPNARRMAELIQEDWSRIGIDAEIVSFEWGEYLERTRKGEHETALLGWTGDNGDPDNFMYVLLGCDAANTGTNIANWCNRQFNQLLEEAKQTGEVSERTRLYEEAQLLFKSEAPWVTIAHSITSKAMRNNVENYTISPLGRHDFYRVDLLPEQAN